MKSIKKNVRKKTLLSAKVYFIALSFQVCEEILQTLQEKQMHVQMVKFVGTEGVCKSVLASVLIRLRLAPKACS